MFNKDKNIVPNQAFDIKTHNGFENIYRVYARNMYSYAFHKTQDNILSQEIVQNIFKRLWERRKSVTLKSSWENYLMRAVKFEIIDVYRSKDRKKNQNTAILETHACTENNIDNKMAADELQIKIDDLIAQLPKQCRNVFKMSRENGYTNKHIAQELEISVRAVEFHITKALAFLRTHLKHEYLVSLLLFL